MILKDSKNTYKKGLKGIGVFGGLQAYRILLSVITAKVSAIFLGPAGSGIYGLLTSVLTTTETLVGCGLGTSAVKDIAKAKNDENGENVAKIYCTVRFLVWITGTIGSVLIFIFAEKLSFLILSSDNYAIWLRILSVSVLLNQLTTGQGVLLTGYQKYKLITKNGLLAGLCGAIITVICYSLWNIKGIVPVILLSALSKYIISTIYVKKIKLPRCIINTGDIVKIGKPIFILGISIGISSAFTSLSGFGIRTVISNMSDIATVGLFTSSFALVNTYFGLVFTSLQGDYYPRLSEVGENHNEYKKVMLDEIELLILLVVPLVALLIVFAKIVLIVFYSSKFVDANILIGWSAFSMLVRVPGWAMSTGLISKGCTSLYLKNQLSFIVYQFAFNVLGFLLGGLTGIGITYTISELIYFVQNYWIQNRNFGVTLSYQLVKLLLVSFGSILTLCLIVTLLPAIYHYTLGSVICLAVIIYSLRELNSRIAIIDFIKSKLQKTGGH